MAIRDMDVAAAVIGIDIRKLKVAALVRSKPSARPAVMVEPDRETPGISAKTCAMPISSAKIIATRVSETVIGIRVKIMSETGERNV